MSQYHTAPQAQSAFGSSPYLTVSAPTSNQFMGTSQYGGPSQFSYSSQFPTAPQSSRAQFMVSQFPGPSQYSGYAQPSSTPGPAMSYPQFNGYVPTTSSLPSAALPTGYAAFQSHFMQHPQSSAVNATMASPTIPPPTTPSPAMSPEMAALLVEMRIMKEQMNKLTVGSSRVKSVDPKEVHALPYKFKMPEIAKFEGMSCPKTHIDSYVMSMGAKGCTPENMAQHFHLSLKDSALRWFLSLIQQFTSAD